MKFIVPGITVAISAALLTSCVVHEAYYSDEVPNNGYVHSQSPVMTGYNRDYQAPRPQAHSAPRHHHPVQANGYGSHVHAPANNGYAANQQGPSAPEPTNGYSAHEVPANQPTNNQNGYSANQHGQNGYVTSANNQTDYEATPDGAEPDGAGYDSSVS